MKAYSRSGMGGVKWIDIKKEKPSNYEQVLITDGNIVTAATANTEYYTTNSDIFWNGCEFGGYEWEWDFNEETITHWAPLPAPPSQTRRGERMGWFKKKKESKNQIPWDQICDQHDCIRQLGHKNVPRWALVGLFGCQNCKDFKGFNLYKKG